MADSQAVPVWAAFSVAFFSKPRLFPATPGLFSLQPGSLFSIRPT
jgi:hypothetical protein